MKQAHVVEFLTTDKLILNGLWFGPRKTKRVIIWVHGLGGSAFSRLNIVEALVDAQTAVLTFNNRGHDKVTTLSDTSGKRHQGGAAHEVFTECADDIQGAINFAKRSGAKEVFLAGHSTGCQKSIYWASKKGRGVKGVIILAPMSDYAAELKASGRKALRRAEAKAREYVRSRKPHALLPDTVWSFRWLADAQRFISLYTGNSAEEIFTYWDANRIPRTLRSVKNRVLALIAEKDEYADRPAGEIYDWFLEHLYEGEVAIVPGVMHGFKGGEKKVATLIKDFMKEV